MTCFLQRKYRKIRLVSLNGILRGTHTTFNESVYRYSNCVPKYISFLYGKLV